MFHPRQIVATAVSLVAVLGVVACGSDDNNNDSSASASTTKAASTQAASTTGAISVKPRTIGVLSVSGASQSVQLAQTAISDALKTLGWKQIFVDAQGDPVKITKGAGSILIRKPDAFIGLAIAGAQIRPQLLQMDKAGITTCQAGLAGGTDAPFDLALGEDETKMGALVGQEIAKEVKEPKVVLLANPQNVAGTAREKGFKDALLAASPNAKIVFRSVIDFADPVGSATKAMNNALAKYPDANAVYPVFDFSLPPAMQVINQRKSKAKIFGHYTSSTTTPQLRKASSPIAAVIDNNAGISAGVSCIDQFLKKFENGTDIKGAADTKQSSYTYNVVTPANVNDLVKRDETVQFTAPQLYAPFVKEWQSEYSGK
jgi:DNA-binding LacI/PurR family transcriptional regulator